MNSDTNAARIAELEEDNRRLRRLLDHRDAPGELRHRLRSTLAMLRTIIRSSAASGRDLEAYSAHLEDRVDALARAQAAADLHGEIGLHQFLADELFHYGASEGERVLLSGPEICLQTRAGQVFALALHELAINAVEHGVLGGSGGRLDVSWRIDGAAADRALCFTWKEIGSTLASDMGPEGFGTEVLTRMLAYELKAEAVLTLEPDGLRCSLRFALPERVGRVVPPRDPRGLAPGGL